MKQFHLARGFPGKIGGSFGGIQHRFTFKHNAEFPLRIKSFSFYGPHKKAIQELFKDNGVSRPTLNELYSLSIPYIVWIEVKESFANGRAGKMLVFMKEMKFIRSLVLGEMMEFDLKEESESITLPIIPPGIWVDILFQLDGLQTEMLDTDDKCQLNYKVKGDKGTLLHIHALCSSAQLAGVTFTTSS